MDAQKHKAVKLPHNIEKIIDYYRGKDIAIIANGKSTIDQSTGLYWNYGEAFEHIWTVNLGWHSHRTSECGFMMDDWASPAHDQPGRYTRDEKAQALLETTIPIITPTEYIEFPCLLKYPLRRVMEYTKVYYYGETISYMLAFAILCGVRSIALQGTDYINCKGAERACTEQWMRSALDRGIKVTTNPESHFFNTQLDGVNNHVPSFYGYLMETFPFKVTPQDSGVFNIDLCPNREKEIEEFKKNYKQVIEDRNAS